MTGAERAICYCQAIWANEQLEAAAPLIRDELWQEGLERKSPEDAAAEETCTVHAGTARGGLSLWWGLSMVGSVQSGLGPKSLPAHLGWAGRRLLVTCAVSWLSSGISPKDSGSTCGCTSQISQARLVLDLILGISDTGRG